MKSFTRIFEYVWPQWNRVVVIVFCALVVGILFSLSFVTIIPLLKVMMGEEGLHGWVDRKTSSWRYSLDIYVPDRLDFINAENTDIAYYLLVTNVEKAGPAEKAGLRQEDRIVGAGDRLIGADTQKTPSSELLEELATAANHSEITVQYRRPDKEGAAGEIAKTTVNSGPRPFFFDYVQRVMAFLPRREIRANRERAVILIILLMAVFTVVRCIARFYQQYLAEKIVQTATAQLRQDTFAHTMEMPVGFFAREGPSDTVSRLVRDTAQIGQAVKIVLGKSLREPTKAICVLACAMLIDYKLTLIFLCATPLTVGLLARFGRKIKRATKKSLASWAAMLGKLEEAIGSVKVVKVYNRQEYETTVFGAINRKLLKQLFRISKVDASTGPIMEVMGMFAGAAALLFGAHWVTAKRIDPSEFLALVALLGTAAESVRKSSSIWNKIQQANAAAERVYGILDEPREKEKPGALELAPLREAVEFKDVFFSYPGTNGPVLKGVNLSVRAGHNVAIVGPNGSGKTTLMNLIPRFYDADSGQILIDGKNIQNATLGSLRSQIGMVTQNVVTFNETIATNIGYGKPRATRAEIIEAARHSFAHEFIEPLPDGYDTIIGEQGAGLSGGQLQRIVIARAILKNPAILIFDEATSQVDADSEAKIHKAIEEFMQSRVSFIIAHRFSTVIKADVIVVMNEGRIIAQGKHGRLMQDCRLYQSLYETQLLET